MIIITIYDNHKLYKLVNIHNKMHINKIVHIF